MPMAMWLLPVPVPPTATAPTLLVEERTASQIVHERLVDRCDGEGEVGKLLRHRQLGRRHLVADRARLLLGNLRLQQCAKDLIDAVLALDAGGDDLVIGRLAIPPSCNTRSISRISERSMGSSHAHRLRVGGREKRRRSQAVVTTAVGKRTQSEPKPVWRRNRCRRRQLIAPRQDIEDHVRAVRASVLRLGTGRLDSNETIAQHRSQRIDHLGHPARLEIAWGPLPVAVLHALELACP
jgi:hypothetical protein